MSDLTHSSLACKAHLNNSLENALHKFIIIIIIINIHTETLAFFLGEGLLLDTAFLFFSGDFFFFSFSLCLGFSSASESPSLSEEDGSLSNLVREQNHSHARH